MVGVAAGLIARVARVPRARVFAVWCFLAYASHLLLDMLSTDSRAKYGVPLFWPLSGMYFNAPFDVFIAITREPGSGSFLARIFSWHNAQAVLREMLIMGAAVLGAHVLGARLARPTSETKTGRGRVVS
jgi:hypothetical protein